jgi:hypothetical protein
MRGVRAVLSSTCPSHSPSGLACELVPDHEGACEAIIRDERLACAPLEVVRWSPIVGDVDHEARPVPRAVEAKHPEG